MRRVTWAAAAMAAVLAACHPHAPPPDLSMDPAALLAQVRAAQEKVQRVRGRARVKIKSPTLSGSVEEYVAAEKPDRLRLETLDFFGNVAAVLVADGDRFAFYDARDKVFYRGKPTPENISRLLPIVLPASELVTILCGSAPVMPGRPVSVTVRDRLALLTIADGDTGQRLAVGDGAAVEDSRVRRMEAGPDGKPVEVAPAYDLLFDTFHRAGPIRFPRHLELDAPSAGVRVQLTWRNELEVNGSPEPQLFHLDPPRNARVVELRGDAPIPATPLPIEPSAE